MKRSEEDPQIDMLLEMGFLKDVIQAALKRTGGNFDDALNILLQDKDRAKIAAASKAGTQPLPTIASKVATVVAPARVVVAAPVSVVVPRAAVSGGPGIHAQPHRASSVNVAVSSVPTIPVVQAPSGSQQTPSSNQTDSSKLQVSIHIFLSCL